MLAVTSLFSNLPHWLIPIAFGVSCPYPHQPARRETHESPKRMCFVGSERRKSVGWIGPEQRARWL
jgi:hypothetical protein